MSQKDCLRANLHVLAVAEDWVLWSLLWCLAGTLDNEERPSPQTPSVWSWILWWDLLVTLARTGISRVWQHAAHNHTLVQIWGDDFLTFIEKLNEQLKKLSKQNEKKNITYTLLTNCEGHTRRILAQGLDSTNQVQRVLSEALLLPW